MLLHLVMLLDFMKAIRNPKDCNCLFDESYKKALSHRYLFVQGQHNIIIKNKKNS